jgi:hypothetical protein
MAGVGAYRRERLSRKLDLPWRAGQIQKRPTYQAIQPRFEACGAWERAYNTRYISRMFFVPKPGVNK